jgi:hypothetical protein
LDGSSAHFLSTGAELSVNSVNLGLNYTISIWVKDITTRTTPSFLFVFNTHSIIFDGDFLRSTHSSFFVNHYFYYSLQAALSSLSSGWNHIVLVRDLAPHLYLYLNGEFVSSAHVPRENDLDDGPALLLGVNRGLFAEYIDELRIYQRALTPEQIFALFNAEKHFYASDPPVFNLLPSSLVSRAPFVCAAVKTACEASQFVVAEPTFSSDRRCL